MIEFIEPIGKKICLDCIFILRVMAKQTGISYEVLNVIGFIILGPLSTLSFIASTYASICFQGKRRRTALIVFMTVGTVATLAIIIPNVIAWWGAMQIWHSKD